MSRKLKVITLILVTLSIVFGTQVGAELHIAKPEIIYPEYDFSLDNPEVLLQIQALVASLRDQDLQIIGPFCQYYVNGDGTLELRAANYNVFLPDGTPSLITLFINSNGSLCGMMSFNASSSPEYIDENHIIVGNESETYIVKNSGIAELSAYQSDSSDYASDDRSRINVRKIIDNFSAYLLSYSEPQSVILRKSID